MKQPIPKHIKLHHISVIDWWEKVLDGKIYVPMAVDKEKPTESKYRKIIQKIDPQTNEIVAEYDTIKQIIGKSSDYNFTLALDNGCEYNGYYYQWAFELKDGVNEPKVKKNGKWTGYEVIQIDPKTYEVVGRYETITDAVSRTKCTISIITYAIKKGVERDGYYWQRVKIGEDPKPVEIRETKQIKQSKENQRFYTNEKVAVCKIDPKTGEVIETYQSIKEASRATGYSIQRLNYTMMHGLERNGYIYVRQDGKTKPKVVRFVKIDPKTGEVIGKYKSVSEALRSMGITNRRTIKEAATSGKPYKGYVWKRIINK